jgi:hypothetical protein
MNTRAQLLGLGILLIAAQSSLYLGSGVSTEGQLSPTGTAQQGESSTVLVDTEDVRITAVASYPAQSPVIEITVVNNRSDRNAAGELTIITPPEIDFIWVATVGDSLPFSVDPNMQESYRVEFTVPADYDQPRFRATIRVDRAFNSTATSANFSLLARNGGAVPSTTPTTPTPTETPATNTWTTTTGGNASLDDNSSVGGLTLLSAAAFPIGLILGGVLGYGVSDFSFELWKSAKDIAAAAGGIASIGGAVADLTNAGIDLTLAVFSWSVLLGMSVILLLRYFDVIETETTDPE